jgi:hypothetical protein
MNCVTICHVFSLQMQHYVGLVCFTVNVESFVEWVSLVSVNSVQLGLVGGSEKFGVHVSRQLRIGLTWVDAPELHCIAGGGEGVPGVSEDIVG